MAYRVAINGFGRIGRTAFKVAQYHPEVEVVAINDLADNENLAYLLRNDSAYGKYSEDVDVDGDNLVVGGLEIKMLAEPDPAKLPWKEMNVDVVIESTGFFVESVRAQLHIDAGAKAVVISAPPKGDNPAPIGVIGANELSAKNDRIFSNASCTTNCVSPVMAVLETAFGIQKAMMTTIHAYTSTQNIQDGPHKDFRRGRAGAFNVVPTSTGAATATTEVLPNLKGKFDGIAIRVPVITGSLTDITAVLNKKTTAEEINSVFKEQADKGLFRGVLAYARDPLVSSDVVGSSYSAIFDPDFTRVVDGDLVKVVAWYDNESGYSTRLVEQVINIARQIA